REPPGKRLFLLLTARDDLPPLRQAGATSIQLTPLAPRLTDAMLRELLGSAPELNSLRSLLTTRTYGNPFFIEETVRSVIESGVLVGTFGRYQLRGPNPDINIPPSAEALIAARIDGLAPEVKALIQTTAVVGSETTIELLQKVSALEEGEFRRRLAVARDSGLMFEVQLFPSPMCGFRHAVTHEVAYGGLLQAQRKAL